MSSDYDRSRNLIVLPYRLRRLVPRIQVCRRSTKNDDSVVMRKPINWHQIHVGLGKGPTSTLNVHDTTYYALLHFLLHSVLRPRNCRPEVTFAWKHGRDLLKAITVSYESTHHHIHMTRQFKNLDDLQSRRPFTL